MRRLVLYHGGCNDGFCAAWVYRRCVDSGAEFRPVQHGEDPPDVIGRDVVLLDFSYRRPTLETMLAEANALLIIDHHETVRRELEGLSSYVFSTGKSAARLVWEHFFDPHEQTRVDRPPWLVDYTEDRDLWRWLLPHSRAVNAALDAYPRRFDTWDEICLRGPEEMAAEGQVLLRYQDRLIRPRLRYHGWTRIAGVRVPVTNSTALGSEVATALARNQPFAAVFFVKRDSQVVYTLRSCGEQGLDVGRIAREYGGGGHRNAAAFTVPRLLPMEREEEAEGEDL